MTAERGSVPEGASAVSPPGAARGAGPVAGAVAGPGAQMPETVGRGRRWLRYGWPLPVAMIVGLLLCANPAWRAVELRTFDRLVVHTAPRDVAMPITVVAIDEESMAAIGRQWPWPRSLHARLLDRLTEAGAAVVALDLVLGEPSGDPAEDRALADSIRRARHVVLAANIEHRETPQARQWIRVDPLPVFLEAGAGAGLATIRTDADGVQRGVPLSQAALWRVVVQRLSAVHPGIATGIEPDEASRIRYLGPTGTFPTIPYYRLLDPERHLGADWRQALRDNVVLVGRTLKTTTELSSVVPDMFLTPFFPVTGELMPGVEIHANLVANAVAGEALREAPRGFSMLLVAGTIGVLALATRRWRPLPALAWSTGLVVAVVALDVWLFRAHRLWLPAAAALASVGLAFAAQATAAFAAERARRAEIRRAFSLYVAPAIVDEIVAHPESLALGGDRREVTLLFTDLVGFTAVSESRRPEEVARLLNTHLDEMTAIVMRHGGTVDKFIGDAVMAFWGAPTADADQSLHALEAAVEMQAAVAASRARDAAAGGPELHMRIGLHRGECIVGNMGGSARFAYTAVGDAVNLASRIEGANKVYGTEILVSEAVAAAVAHRASLRPVDTVRVQGKSKPVGLYTPCDDERLVQRTVEALDAWKTGRWEEARRAWSAIAADHPCDPVARTFLARLRTFPAERPPAGWDGVTPLGSK